MAELGFHPAATRVVLTSPLHVSVIHERMLSEWNSGQRIDEDRSRRELLGQSAWIRALYT
jgi:hypothetical protein